MSICTIHCQQKVRECLKGLDSSKIRIGPIRNSIIFFSCEKWKSVGPLQKAKMRFTQKWVGLTPDKNLKCSVCIIRW